jgi:hypothetical protein
MGGVTPPTPRWSAQGNSGRRSCRWQRRRIQESLRSLSRRWSRIRRRRGLHLIGKFSGDFGQPERRLREEQTHHYVRRTFSAAVAAVNVGLIGVGLTLLP